MATTTVTPNTGAAGAGDQGGAAASSAAAQPQHSSDRALANFNSGDPAKGGAAPAADAKPAGAVGTPGAVADAGAAAAAGDLEKLDLAGVLGEDLTAVAEPAKPAADAAAAADPNAALEALKDNPRVIELQAAETAVKTAMAVSSYLQKPEHLVDAVKDAHVLWDITEGKQKVDVILEAAKQTNPERFKTILTDLKTFLEKEGVQVAAPAAIDAANMTPEQKRIAALEKDAADRKTADEKAAQERKVAEFNTRVTTTKKTILDTKMPELLKDSIFEGEGELFLELVGKQLIPKTPELIASIEKGDFKMLETAVKVARSQEAKRFKERIDRAVALQKKKLLTVPKQPAAGAPAAGADTTQTAAVADKEARRKNMVAMLKTGASAS